MPVVGTAGHVDHGKSTLVHALTGRDPDRWAEEKARGLTIDLGFAWAVLPGGEDVSFVDVPGHEHFIKNMLAGIEAIDAALLVVAADEGWMPQSEEHLAVLDLLGVERGVVALTKADRVDADLIELATLEIEERLGGSSLESAPIIPVSAVTGSGLDRLREELARALAGLPPVIGDRPRLWVDRSFSVAGAGTVVTGTLLDGGLEVGDRLELWPGGVEARVRGIQSHEREVARVEPRRRVAVNLAGVERSAIARGGMLGRPGQWVTTRRLAARVRPARYVTELTDRGSYHLHLGSGAHPVRLRLLEPDLAIIELLTPLPLKIGDRFILRETGRRLVMGGGQVVDPAPSRSRRKVLSTVASVAPTLAATPDDQAVALLAARGEATARDLSAHTGGGRSIGAVTLGGTLFTAGHAAEVISEMIGLVEEFHRANPLRSGFPLASLAGRMRLPVATLESLVATDARLVGDGPLVRSAAFRVGRSDEEEKTWRLAQARLAEAGWAVPRATELGLGRELIHSLVREGALVRVSGDYLYLPKQMEELVTALRTFREPFTVSEFKDRIGMSRKYAVPWLEWSDAAGHTVRMGDRRRVRG